MFAWEAYERGTDVHVQADPTKLEFAEKEFQKRSKEHKETVKTSILEKYGGQEHLDGPPKQLLLAQTVSFSISFLIFPPADLSQTESTKWIRSKLCLMHSLCLCSCCLGQQNKLCVVVPFLSC